MATEEIKLDIKNATYKIWNTEKMKWFYLVEKHSSFPFSLFLVSEDEDVYLAQSLDSAPWLWGERQKL